MMRTLPLTQPDDDRAITAMTNTHEMTPAEVKAMDDAFDAGVAEALRRRSALVMSKQQIAGVEAWVCLYPPANIATSGMRKWLKAAGMTPTDGDLFIARSQVLKAAKDMGLSG